MSIMPKRGVCFGCGYDHGDSFCNPAVLDILGRTNKAAQEKDAQITQLQQQVADLEAEEEISDAVREKLLRILAEIAIVLKGPELHLHWHGYRDLAELVTVNVLEVQLSRARIEQLEAAQPAIAKAALEAAGIAVDQTSSVNESQDDFQRKAISSIGRIDPATIAASVKRGE